MKKETEVTDAPHQWNSLHAISVPLVLIDSFELDDYLILHRRVHDSLAI